MSTKRRITQETFDAAVAENIEEFEMEPAEAVEDAIEQFKSQGVDLSNIVTDVGESKEEHPVLGPLKQLRTASEAESEDAEEAIMAALKALSEGVHGNKGHQTVASSNGAIELVSSITESSSGAQLTACFDTMRALIRKHPENRKLVKKPFVQMVANTILGMPEDNELLVAALGVGATLCFRTEDNKRTVYESNAPKSCLKILARSTNNVPALKACMALLRNIITNDDRSTPMSKAFDFARELHEEGLAEAVLAVARGHPDVASVVADAFGVLRSQCVNNPICIHVVEDGKALELVATALTAMSDDLQVLAGGAALLRTLAGNDENKKLIGDPESPTLKVLLRALQMHMTSPKVAEHCCGAFAALTLRSPENATTIVENAGHALIVRCMRLHLESSVVCRQACLAIRNMASRSPELRSKILSEGVQPLLETIKEKHRSATDFAKAAIRDLGVDGLPTEATEEELA